ncbi:MAG: hypothetical protein ACLS5P_09625 [Enterococcus faecium]
MLEAIKTAFSPQNDQKVLDPLKQLGNREIEILKSKGYDLDFLKQVMPQGGLNFDEEYVTYGNGYSRCVTVYHYTKNPTLFWLANLMNNPHTVATLDVSTDEKQKVIDQINRALDELNDRSDNERKATDRNKSAEEYLELAEYARKLTSNGEISKQVKVRVHVYGNTIQEVDERAQELIENLKGMDYRAVTYLHKTKRDWQSMFTMFDEQAEWSGNIKGQSLPSLNILGQLELPGASQEKKNRKEEMESIVESLCETYGMIFDGHSTIRHLDQQQLVFFDIDSITGLDRGVQQCQMYMAMTLIWNQALIQGRRQRRLIKEKQMEEQDFKRFLAMIDECHNAINPDFIETVNYVTNFQREMRKVEAMTVLATQSPQEMVPENMSSDNFSKLKKVFEFSSTKIFMRMDESILRHIEGLVGKSMTNSELESIPQQNQGDAVINFGSKETIRVHFSPNKRQLKLFDGGK